jgi:transcriptional regulator with XRE-family HTH domain
MTYNHDIFCKAFRKLVVRARKESFITQRQLSIESGLTRQFISMMEGGKRIPSYENFCLLARGLGLSAAEMSEKFLIIYERECRSVEERLKRLAESGALLVAERNRGKEYMKQR